MDFITSFMPDNLAWLFILIASMLSLYIFLKVNWLKNLQRGIIHVWFASIFVLSLIWMMRATLESGLNIHLAGIMLITLMFGWQLSVLAITLVCILNSLWGHSLPINLGLAILINAYLTVSFCYLFFLIIEKYLPRNLYVYLYISAFFGAALSFSLAGSVSVLALGLFNAYPWSVLVEDYLPFYYLMGFGESFMTCGLITLLVVYRPNWVYSFRDEKYLFKK